MADFITKSGVHRKVASEWIVKNGVYRKVTKSFITKSGVHRKAYSAFQTLIFQGTLTTSTDPVGKTFTMTDYNNAVAAGYTKLKVSLATSANNADFYAYFDNSYAWLCGDGTGFYQEYTSSDMFRLGNTTFRIVFTQSWSGSGYATIEWIP